MLLSAALEADTNHLCEKVSESPEPLKRELAIRRESWIVRIREEF